ncbi:MAG TPA: hypothetical protein VK155_11495 [Bacteroidales bacterium]|jgi:hypothetical protein|nr:hypothetical protein [Bacteroidales bacterium]
MLLKVISASALMALGINAFCQKIEFHGWEFWPGFNHGYKAEIDNKYTYKGMNSVRIQRDEKNNYDICSLLQTFSDRNLAGKRVRMTGYIRSPNYGDSAFMWVRVADYNKRMSTDYGNTAVRIRTSRNWMKHEIVFDVGDNCEIFFGFMFRGNERAWFDNVSFETVSNSTLKTTISLNTPLTDADLEKYPDFEVPRKVPVNLDFEDE